MSSLFKKNMVRRAGYYRTSDITRQVDRTSTTLLRWEKKGLILKAKRDSRGWRIYTKSEIRKIVRLVKNSGYFEKKNIEKVN